MSWLSYRARAEVRTRWRSLLALALFVAVVGGVVLATVAGARRTSTAVDRLRAHALEPDTFLDTRDTDPALADDIAGLPSVRAAAPVAFVYAFPKDSGYYPLLVAQDDRAQRTVARGLLVAGRFPAPGTSGELAVSESMATRLKLRVGSNLELVTFTEEGAHELEEDEEAFDPDGPEVTVRIVGIVRSTQDIAARDEDPTLSILPRGFYEKYRGRVHMVEGSYLVSYRGGPDAAAEFAHQLHQLYAGGPSPGIDAGTNTAQLLGQSTEVQATGLAAFAAVFLLFGMGAIAQTATRSVHSATADQLTLASMGLTRSGRWLAAAVPTALAAAAGCVGAVLVAAAASPLLPVGLARRAEPDPGFAFDAVALGGGGALLLLVTVAVVAWPAWRLSRSAVGAGSAAHITATPSLANRLARVGRPSMAVGVDMATRRGRGPTEVAVRSAFVGALVGVAGLAATVVFAGSLQHLLDTPSLYGWSWDVATSAQVVDEVTARADVDAVALARLNRTAEINGRSVFVAAIENKKGELAPPVARGRAPSAADEIALGAELRRRLGDPDRVVMEANQKRASYRVVGTAVSASIGDPIPLDGGALVTTAGLDRVDLVADVIDSSGYNQTLVKFRPGVDPRKAASTIRVVNENDRGIIFPVLPPEVSKLEQVKGLPRLLGLFLGALAVVALLHALVQTMHRRRLELGVLRAIGFTRAQVSGAISWQAAVLAVVAAVVGLPLGIAVGRWVWTLVAAGLGVIPRPDFALPLFLVVPVAALAAAAIGALLGSFAGRTPAAVALRTE